MPISKDIIYLLIVLPSMPMCTSYDSSDSSCKFYGLLIVLDEYIIFDSIDQWNISELSVEWQSNSRENKKRNKNSSCACILFNLILPHWSLYTVITSIFLCIFTLPHEIHVGKKTTTHNHIPFTFHAQFQLQVISCSTSSFLCAIYSWTRWLWFAPTFAWICFRIPAGCQSIKGTGKSSYGASSAAQRNVTSSRRIKLLG